MWNKVKSLFIKEQGDVSVVSNVQNSTAQYMDGGFIGNAVGGYAGNEIVNACVDKRARSLAEAPIVIKDKNNELVEQHPTVALMTKPNPFQSGFEFIERWSQHLDLAGNAFVWKARGSGNKVAELWTLQPDRVAIVASKDGFISHYVYTLDGAEMPIPKEDIIHFKNGNPLNQFFGLATIKAASHRVEMDNDMTDMLKGLVQEGGVPTGILTTVDADISQAEVSRLKKAWNQNYSGQNKGGIAVLTGDATFEKISYNPDELAAVQITNITESRICMVFGVSPIIIGAHVGLESSTYSNYETAISSFFEETILPLQRKVAAVLTMDLDLNPVQTDTIMFDNSGVGAFRSRREAKALLDLEYVTAGIKTVNEVRADLGLDPLDDFELEELEEEEEERVEPEEEPEVKEKNGCGCPSKALQSPKVNKADSRDIRLLREALGTLQQADEHLDRVEHTMKKIFKSIGQDIAAIFVPLIKSEGEFLVKQDGDIIIPPDVLAAITSQVGSLGPVWTDNISKQIEPVMKSLMAAAGASAANKVGVAFDLTNELVVSAVKGQTLKLAGSVSENTIGIVKAKIATGIEAGLPLKDISNSIKPLFVGEDAAKRATRIARTEVIRGANEGARASYQSAGVTKMVWVAAGDACPYCTELDGKVVGIDEKFVKVGDHFQPDGASAPLNTSYGDISAPPAHPNCRCSIAAEFE